MANIVAFNVKYSANTGDGVIAECMERAIERGVPGVTVVTLDLAGREAYGETTVRARALVLKTLALMPPLVRRRVVRFRLTRMLDHLESRWRGAVEGASLVVVGGGNLLQDDDLNFPLKVGRALHVASSAGVPTVVHAVGAVPGWSAEARECLSALRDPKVGLSVRDEASRAALAAETGRGDIAIARDPGLLSRDLLSADAATSRGEGARPVCGLGIIHPAVTSHHAGRSSGGVEAFERLGRAVLDSGRDLTLFTNGAVEDEAMLVRVHAAIVSPGRASRVTVAPRPRTPRDLVRIVAGLDVLVAHRLHACIVAYALDVPAIGLTWDAKVRSFFASTGREEFVSDTLDPAAIIALVERAAAGYDEPSRAVEIERARADLVDVVRHHLAGPSVEHPAA